jgi:hypothetical protein
LFICDECVSLRAERIDLEDIGVAAVVSGVDHNLKIVIEFLAYIAAELGGHRSFHDRIVTRYAKVNLIPRVQHSYFRSLGRGLAFVGLSLFETRNRGSLLPERVVERAIQTG